VVVVDITIMVQDNLVQMVEDVGAIMEIQVVDQVKL
jgi:hypothetical protein